MSNGHPTNSDSDYHVHTCLRSGCLVDIPGCNCGATEDGAECLTRCVQCLVLDALEEAQDILEEAKYDSA